MVTISRICYKQPRFRNDAMNFLANSGQHPKMGLEPDFLINKPMDFHEKTDKNIVNFFVEKLVIINEIFKKQMVFVQVSNENYANIYKQNAPNYVFTNFFKHPAFRNPRHFKTHQPVIFLE